MAGIYIHIPFCKQACYYCDFHFSTSLKLKNDVIDSILKEIEFQKNYLNNQPIKSIYFGGGTPSLLSPEEINKIIEQINKYQDISSVEEITLEANPDDLSLSKLLALKKTKINRLSIGIQSFNNDELKYLNRVHTSEDAFKCIKYAQDCGFNNITIDLIYGIPVFPSGNTWQKNLHQAFELDIQHLSCYALTIEDKTVFGNWLRKGKINVMDDQVVNQQFLYLIEEASKKGFEQYEISNYAKKGYTAFHNSNYWKGVHYLGIGPGAHSYNGKERQFNIANNPKYIQKIKQNIRWYDIEKLTKSNMVNEYFMTGLRTKWGCDLRYIENTFSIPRDRFMKVIEQYLSEGLILFSNGNITLTNKGKLLSDSISSSFFI